MVRSFGYATFTALGAATINRPEDLDRLTPWADLWERWVAAAFLRTYRTAARPAAVLPSDPGDFDIVLRAYVLDKAFYELGYELSHRPDWVHIPLIGLIRLAVDPPVRVPPQEETPPPLHA
jgi:maltose alpha-D-glucosyltransferase/alpha-amylase